MRCVVLATHLISFKPAILMNNTTTGDIHKCIATKVVAYIDLYQLTNYIALQIKIFCLRFRWLALVRGIQFRLNALDNIACAK